MHFYQLKCHSIKNYYEKSLQQFDDFDFSFFRYTVLFFQLNVFDSNKDGKLQLSEMAK